jgi:hypothetical protein
MAKRIETRTLSWGSGTTDVTVALNTPRIPLGIQMPAAFTGTSIEVHASHDGTTYAPIFNAAGTAYTLTVSTTVARYIPLDRTLLDSVRFIRFVASSQASARTATLITGE